ncbi:protein CfxQ homolog [Salvia hispanica]|uniref:protein CfxQ homolog n=1 Tax=Salvia hispanica TaxID=49212 RepID=UPI00200912AC|nr:protein CfxQ homolog [Salvia hispanica]
MDEMKRKMDDFDLELSTIVGLEELKAQLRKWSKGMIMDEKRRAIGVDLGQKKLPHMAFLGNPGTGKTTVARILGKLLSSIGILSSDKVTEVQRTDLVGQYIGHTGLKTRDKIKEAKGGILFVDEAYRLAPITSGKHVEYGVEALEEIMSAMEEDDDLLVIFAGYPEPMKRIFSSNEGFCRRVACYFHFDNFSCRELAEMLTIKMSTRERRSRLFGFRLGPCCSVEVVASVIERRTSEKVRNKMNGGLVDHMLNNAKDNLDSRLDFEAGGDELFTITLPDLEAGLDQLARLDLD